jgi:hypothetical protein
MSCEDDRTIPRDAAPNPAREAIASRLVAAREKLLGRIRGQLARVGGRGADAQDVFSTTVRRADVLAAAGRIAETIPDEELLALAGEIARRASFESARKGRRQRDIAERRRRAGIEANGTTDTTTTREFAELFGDRDRSGGDSSDSASSTPGSRETAADRGPLPAAAGLVPEDLEVIGLRLRDASWSVIAEALGTTVAGAHRRYYRAIAALAAAAEARQRAGSPPTP